MRHIMSYEEYKDKTMKIFKSYEDGLLTFEDMLIKQYQLTEECFSQNQKE